ncbi:hypothetical protein PHJA_002344800 [Phtheirospermum japonicum]|uniref:Uncharacterized protein n=1 Tax=Phtheirospermum japonicum TaxID=374723 RepID=A0A830CWS0_9LAMI|nr:hypothetical protein PHJA_002344800 [Phtheirospermum japonicum]
MSFEEMDPIFGRVVPEWSPPSPHTTPSSPFLYRVHCHGSDHSALRVIATDFQSKTFQAIKSRQQLEDLTLSNFMGTEVALFLTGHYLTSTQRDDIGIGGSWSEFVDYVAASLKSGDVKLILEGSSKSGGADYAKLIAQKAKGMPRVSFSLSKLVDGAAGEAMANVALELYKEFNDVKSLLIEGKEEMITVQFPFRKTLAGKSASSPTTFFEEQESKYQLTKVIAAEQLHGLAKLVGSNCCAVGNSSIFGFPDKVTKEWKTRVLQEKNVTLQKQLDMVLYSRKHKSHKINDREISDSTSVLVSQGSSGLKERVLKLLLNALVLKCGVTSGYLLKC